MNDDMYLTDAVSTASILLKLHDESQYPNQLKLQQQNGSISDAAFLSMALTRISSILMSGQNRRGATWHTKKVITVQAEPE